MLRIGLTGGMGSGKTTVAKIFETLAVPVYYADDAAKKLMNESDLLKKEIILQFGEGTYTGTDLNRSYLANIVFKDPKKLAVLNSIVHPATLLDAKNWMDLQTATYAIKEAALLFEAGAQKDLNYVIGVSSPLSLRIQRIMERDTITMDEINARMNKQMSETVKMKLCDFILVNDERELLIPQVLGLHKKLVFLNSNL